MNILNIYSILCIAGYVYSLISKLSSIYKILDSLFQCKFLAGSDSARSSFAAILDRISASPEVLHEKSR